MSDQNIHRQTLEKWIEDLQNDKKILQNDKETLQKEKDYMFQEYSKLQQNFLLHQTKYRRVLKQLLKLKSTNTDEQSPTFSQREGRSFGKHRHDLLSDPIQS